jgi:hypothetical protein
MSWETAIKKIEQNLTRWNICHPSLDGKKLIVQMIMSGMTQFLMKAQGMPKAIETALTKLIRSFIWDGQKTSPISLKRLEHPISEVRIGLLNISTRNEAIKITWIKTYMDMSNTRPAWEFATGAIINTL